MKIRILTLLFVLLHVGAWSQNTVQEQFLKELQTKSAHVRTITSDFVQVKHNSMLANDVERGGAFSFKYPARLLLQYADAQGDCVVMGEENFTVKVAGKAKTVKIASNPLYEQLQEVFAACFSGDVAKLSNEGVFRCEQHTKEYTVRISPESKRARRYVAEIVLIFSREDMLLNELKIVEVSGNYTSYLFRNRKTNVELSDELFESKL